MDGTTILVIAGIGFAIGFGLGHGMQEAKIQDCKEVARQDDYFGTSTAARAMAFAECLSPYACRVMWKND